MCTEFKVALLVGSFLMLILVGSARFVESSRCDSYAQLTGRETRLIYFTCYVKHNNEWYSEDEFKIYKLLKFKGE